MKFLVSSLNGQDTVQAGTFWGVLNVLLHASGAQFGWDIIISWGPQLNPLTVQEVIIFGPDCNPKNMMEYPQRILEKVKVNHDKTDRGY